MNNRINAKVKSLQNYLDKEPNMSREMALHFYRCFLELQQETILLESLTATLIERISLPPSLPPFCQNSTERDPAL